MHPLKERYLRISSEIDHALQKGLEFHHGVRRKDDVDPDIKIPESARNIVLSSTSFDIWWFIKLIFPSSMFPPNSSDKTCIGMRHAGPQQIAPKNDRPGNGQIIDPDTIEMESKYFKWSCQFKSIFRGYGRSESSDTVRSLIQRSCRCSGATHRKSQISGSSLADIRSSRNTWMNHHLSNVDSAEPDQIQLN